MKLALNASIYNNWGGWNLVTRDDVSPQVGRVTAAVTFSIGVAFEFMFSED